MITPTDIKTTPVAITMRGKITLCTTPPAPTCARYVIQRVQPGLGNIQSSPNRALQLRLQATIIDRKSPAQLAQRARLAAGNTAWHTLTDDQRNEWRAQSGHRYRTGYTAFLSHYLSLGWGA